jgi:hypothetical protein
MNPAPIRSYVIRRVSLASGVEREMEICSSICAMIGIEL